MKLNRVLIPDSDLNLNMKKLSDGTDYSCTELSLAWLLSQSFVTIPIIGARTPEQIRESMSSAYICLNETDMKKMLANM